MDFKRLQGAFTFSKKEINGLVVFCFLLLAILMAPIAYHWFNEPEVFVFKDFEKEIKSFKASGQAKTRYKYLQVRDEIENNESEPQYFNFNPNNLPTESWGKLGLSRKQIAVIKNYETKGGRFYQKEDLKKIYSISDKEYLSLEPYITIPEPTHPDRGSAKTYELKNPVINTPKVVEINGADSVELETIRGIGPAFASRIIRYRTRLGGFYKAEQLKEVYGIDASKFEQFQRQIVVDVSAVRKININTCGFDDLKAHPYLTFKQINAILQYRKQHGAYSSLIDLKKVILLDELVLSKLGPYLNFNDQK